MHERVELAAGIVKGTIDEMVNAHTSARKIMGDNQVRRSGARPRVLWIRSRHAMACCRCHCSADTPYGRSCMYAWPHCPRRADAWRLASCSARSPAPSTRWSSRHWGSWRNIRSVGRCAAPLAAHAFNDLFRRGEQLVCHSMQASLRGQLEEVNNMRNLMMDIIEDLRTHHACAAAARARHRTCSPPHAPPPPHPTAPTIASA
eukprot:2115952-Prymnesium_polylepis.1